MIIHEVEASGYRNLAPTRLALGPRFNIFHGQNAQGKTNFLEALAVLTELHSFRQATLDQLVAHDGERAHLGMRAHAGGLDYEVRLELAAGSRRLRVNGKGVTRQKDYIGTLPVVVFEPDDVRMSKGGPDRRRRFLDRALFLVQSSHWDRAAEYRQVLRRRNRLLKDQQTRDPLFEVYSDKLAALGAEIAYNRHVMTRSLEARVGESIAAISGRQDDVRLVYASHLEPDENGEPQSDGGARLKALMARSLARDLRVGYTGVGPHVEDLEIYIGGRAAVKFASQGQHRSIALALKIAEIEVIRRMRGSFPALLIDDLSSELDAARRERLFHYLTNTGGQTILTSTDPGIAAGFASEELAVFRVEAGAIVAEGGSPASD